MCMEWTLVYLRLYIQELQFSKSSKMVCSFKCCRMILELPFIARKAGTIETALEIPGKKSKTRLMLNDLLFF